MRGLYKLVDALVCCCEEELMDRARAVALGVAACRGPRERAYLEEKFFEHDRLNALTRGEGPPPRETWVLGETSLRPTSRLLTIEQAMEIVRETSREAFLRRVQRTAQKLKRAGKPDDDFRFEVFIAHRGGGEHRWLFELAI